MTEATTMTTVLKVVDYLHNEAKCCKIVDEDHVMIAKINGQPHKQIGQQMAEAYNETYGKGIKPSTISKMREILKDELIEILKKLEGDSVWHSGIRIWFNQESKVTKDGLIEQLKSQMEDDKEVMTKIIGAEGVRILELL